jgi:hypothetical protein
MLLKKIQKVELVLFALDLILVAFIHHLIQKFDIYQLFHYFLYYR